ncbi:MAG: DJ-1 family glyoxalase III [Treponemataceae bacterium]
MKTAAIFLATGFEEVEAITPIDYLRRANIQVTTVGIEKTEVTGSHGITIKCDETLDALPEFFFDSIDVFIIPGGMPGSANLHACEKLTLILRKAWSNKKLICAICAAPVVVLAPLGILKDKNFTCFPSMIEKLPQLCTDKSLYDTAKYCKDRVVHHENIITSQSAGCAEEFSLAIIDAVEGSNAAKTIGQSILSAHTL